jgi:hypothetical protein
MKRPSYREIDRKLKAAESAVKSGNVFLIKQEIIASDALELGYLIDEELHGILSELIEATSPKDYRGTRPPQRSYEKEIEGLDLFAFQVKSVILGREVYYKFAIMDGCLYLVSLHG